MKEETVAVFIMLISLVCSGIGGWFAAHNTVATECEKLGAFYVGNKTFICEIKK